MKQVIQYAHALHHIAATSKLSADELLLRFKDVLKTRGHEALYPQILQTLLALHTAEADTSLRISVASRKELERFKKTIEKHLSEQHVSFSEDAVHIDDTLIGGYKITQTDRQLDASYKQTLIHLYQTLAA